MDNDTVFTKTAKGITQVNQRSSSLSKDLMRVLKLVDGKSTFAQIVAKAELDRAALEKAMTLLIKDGFARVFETRSQSLEFGEEDFDFTSPGKLPEEPSRVVAAAALDITELAREQERADTERKQRESAQAAAREKARRQAEARAAAVAEAKAKAEAETLAMEQARYAREAADRAKAKLEARVREEEARKRLLAAQVARAEAEEKAKEEEESRRIALLKAKARVEADDRARADIEARVREEETRKRQLAEQSARTEAERNAKEDAEGEQLAEERAKAEAEARSLGEARTRAEAAAQELGKARAEAEALVQRQTQEAVASEHELRARLKEEIETRIRGEMEALLRNEIEVQARTQIQAQIMEEARLAARAELEERLNEERNELQKAEMEVRIQAERAARERAEQESKLREAAEARAVAESVAREKAEEEARRLRQAELRAREKAEIAAREQAEMAANAARERAAAAVRFEEERRAKNEAEARASAGMEESERREAALAASIEAERKARQEAETRARIEARARETVEETTRVRVKAELEGDMTRRAELEGKAQAQAYMEAKQQAELDEEARIRAEQERKARDIAEIMRTKVTADDAAAAAAPARRRPRERVRWVRNGSIAVLTLLMIGISLLLVVPLRGFANKLEKGIGGWLHEDVSISSLNFSLLPSPHLKFEGFTAGKALDVKAARGRVFLDIPALLGDRVAVTLLELDDLAITGEAPRRILSWGKVAGKSTAATIDAVRLRNVTLAVQPALKPFEAMLTFGRDGALRSASLSGEDKWNATLQPRENEFEVTFKARHWQLPLGVPIPTGDLTAKGVLTATDITFPDFEADMLEGKVNGSLKVSWGASIALAADVVLSRVRAEPLLAAFTRDVTIMGKADGHFTVVAESPVLAKLMDMPRVQGKFRLVEGSLSNADLVAAMQSPSAAGRGGVTKFAELSGDLLTGEGRISYRNLILQGGVLRGSGTLDIANGALSGRLNTEIRSNVAQDRGAFAVSGTVARPVLSRGG